MRADAGSGAKTAFKENDTEDVIVPVDTQDGWVVGSDRFDQDTADTTKAERAFFNKVKGAFRAGIAIGTQWNDVNVGQYSHAEGRDAIASGESAHAEGRSTRASATNAHAEGINCVAEGQEAHAEGHQTTASTQAHSEGYMTSASFRAHAEGASTTASGNQSHAEGNSTTASGNHSHAEGDGTQAGGLESHAEGFGSDAWGRGSHAEGMLTYAGEDGSHAEGRDSRAESLNSRAGGNASKTLTRGQDAQGASYFAVAGDAQASRVALLAETTDATAKLLKTGVSPTSTWFSMDVVWALLTNRAYKVRIEAIARRSDVEGEIAGFTWEGVVARNSGSVAGSARIVGTPVETGWSDLAADPWVLGVAINEDDPANPYLEITGTGEAGKTIRWVAGLYVTEVG